MNPEDYYTDIMKKHLNDYDDIEKYLEKVGKWDMYGSSYRPFEEKRNLYEGWDDIEEQIEKYYDRCVSEKNEQPKAKVELNVGDLVRCNCESDVWYRGLVGTLVWFDSMNDPHVMYGNGEVIRLAGRNLEVIK